jgi:hypothetical protein
LSTFAQGDFSPAATQLPKNSGIRLLTEPTVDTYTPFPPENAAPGLQSSLPTGRRALHGNWLTLLKAAEKKLPDSLRKPERDKMKEISEKPATERSPRER